jgi:hypothetical protein
MLMSTDLGAVFHLLAGDGQRVVVAAFEDHAGRRPWNR